MTLLVRAASLTGFAELAWGFRLDPFALAREAGVPPAVLSDPDLKVEGSRVAALLALAAERAGAPDFGLRLAETRMPSNLGPVGLILRDQPTLRRALTVVGQVLWLHNEALSIAVEEDDAIGILRLALAVPGSLSRQSVDLTMGVVVRQLRQLLGPAWRPEAVLLRHSAPHETSVHARVFGVVPTFAAALDGIVVPRGELDAPLPGADPAMARAAERMVAAQASARAQSARDRTRELVVLLMPTGACSADRVADHLGIDRRTLHRRLAGEGTSFTAVHAAARAELARSLVAGGRPLAEAADLAGFASASAFTHWFRRHFGAPPRAWREALAAPPAASA